MKTNLTIKYSNKYINYLDSLKFMETTVDKILNQNANNLIWFLNHDHIYTCGTSANKNEILHKTNIPVIKIAIIASSENTI